MNGCAAERCGARRLVERGTINVEGSILSVKSAPGTMGALWDAKMMTERVVGVVTAARRSPQEGGAALEAIMADYIKQNPPAAAPMSAHPGVPVSPGTGG